MSGNNRKIIHFLSASDRINYGDLLFPIIFKKFAEEGGYKIKLYNYGIVKSNLSKFGAMPTLSYIDLLKNTENNQGGKLVIGGGEVFFADWNKLYSFINPIYYKLNKYKRVQKLMIPKLLLAKNRVDVPFCPSKSELKNDKLKLYFSSVGGSFSGRANSNSNLKIKDTLNSASLLSVRDERVKTSMEQNGLKARLVPDSALIISDYFTQGFLRDKISENCKIIKEPYIFLQIGNFKGPRNLKQFILDLKEVSSLLKLNIVLCPIGKAAGHEDHVILKKIKAYENSFTYIDPESIFDIMYLISHASLYIGTSLHGIITAQSFSVPFIGLNNKLIKVSSYMKTWISESMDCLQFDEISKVTDIFSEWNHSMLLDKTTEQKQLVRDNLKFILCDGE